MQRRPADAGHECALPIACSCFGEPGTCRILADTAARHHAFDLLKSSRRSVKLFSKTIEFVYDVNLFRINQLNIDPEQFRINLRYAFIGAIAPSIRGLPAFQAANWEHDKNYFLSHDRRLGGLTKRKPAISRSMCTRLHLTTKSSLGTSIKNSPVKILGADTFILAPPSERSRSVPSIRRPSSNTIVAGLNTVLRPNFRCSFGRSIAKDPSLFQLSRDDLLNLHLPSSATGHNPKVNGKVSPVLCQSGKMIPCGPHAAAFFLCGAICLSDSGEKQGMQS